MQNDKERDEEWCSMRPKNCKYTLLKSCDVPKIGKVSFGFVKYLKKHWREYDIILLDGYGFVSQLINIRWLNKKKVSYCVNVDGMVPSKKKSGLAFSLKKRIVSKIPYFLCGARSTNSLLIDCGAKEEKIINHPFTSLYNRDLFNAPASIEEKDDLRQKLNIKEKKVIISVGRFSYMGGYGKGYDT